MAVELRYPVYIELLTKDRGFFAGSAKALQMIQALTGQYGKLFAAARKVESSSRYFKDVQAGMLGVKSAASEARVAVVGLAASFAAFEGGKALLKGTVADIKEAAKFQTQLARGSAIGLSAGSQRGLKQYAVSESVRLPGATPAELTSTILNARTYVGGTTEAKRIAPLLQNMAFIHAALMGGGMKGGMAFSESMVRGAEPFMSAAQFGKPGYMKSLVWKMTAIEKASMLTGVDYAPFMSHIATHAGGTAPTWSKNFFLELMGFIRASGNRVGSTAPAIGGAIKMFSGGKIPKGMIPLMIQTGLASIGKYSYAQAISGNLPLQFKESDLARTNLFKWMQTVFLPAIKPLEKQAGASPKSVSQTVGFLQHLGLSVGTANLLGVLISRGQQISNFEKRWKQVQDINGQVAASAKTAAGQLLILNGRFKTLKTVLGDPLIKQATSLLTSLVNVVTRLGKYLSAHPMTAEIVAWTAALGGLALIIGGPVGLIYSGWRLNVTLGALTAAIDLLNASAKAATVGIAGSEAAGAAGGPAGAAAKGGILGWGLRAAGAILADPATILAGAGAVGAGALAYSGGIGRGTKYTPSQLMAFGAATKAPTAAKAATAWFNSLSSTQRGVMATQAASHGIPLNLMVAQLYHESGGHLHTWSPHKKSYGLAQFTNLEWAKYGQGKSRGDFSANIMAYADYMSVLKKRWGANAVMHYNGTGALAQGYQMDVTDAAAAIAPGSLHVHSGGNLHVHIHAATKDIHEALTKGVKRALQASTNAGGQYHSRVQTGGT